MTHTEPKSRREDWLEFWESRELGAVEMMPYVCWSSRPCWTWPLAGGSPTRCSPTSGWTWPPRSILPGRAFPRPGVRAAARGEAVLSPSVATRVVGQVRAPSQEPISQRELEVLELVARGTSNRDAAARLFISEATVKTHLMHIYAKLGVNDRAVAVAEGFDHGLLIPRGTH